MLLQADASQRNNPASSLSGFCLGFGAGFGFLRRFRLSVIYNGDP
jgi:hypothetical protein